MSSVKSTPLQEVHMHRRESQVQVVRTPKLPQALASRAVSFRSSQTISITSTRPRVVKPKLLSNLSRVLATQSKVVRVETPMVR